MVTEKKRSQVHKSNVAKRNATLKTNRRLHAIGRGFSLSYYWGAGQRSLTPHTCCNGPEFPCSASTWGRLLWTSSWAGRYRHSPHSDLHRTLAIAVLASQITQENLGWGWKPEVKGSHLGPTCWALSSKDFLPPSWELPGPTQPQVTSLLPALFPQRVQASRKQNWKAQVISNNFYFCLLNKLPKNSEFGYRFGPGEK